MRALLSVLAVGLLVLVARAPDALACHKGDPSIPHGAQTTCNGGASTFKVVFVTSTIYSADLGGIVFADAECQARADAAGLSGVFRAWLSDGMDSPLTTGFTQSAGGL